VKGLVEKEIATGTPANRIVVGGFSQGGAIAIMMLREMKQLAGVIGVAAPDTEPSIIASFFRADIGTMLCNFLPADPCDHWVCYAGLSCYLPLRNASSGVLAPEMRGVPVFMGHGTDDPLIPMSIGQMTFEVLQGLGSKIELETYPMAHSACPKELSDVAAFLKRVVPWDWYLFSMLFSCNVRRICHLVTYVEQVLWFTPVCTILSDVHRKRCAYTLGQFRSVWISESALQDVRKKLAETHSFSLTFGCFWGHSKTLMKPAKIS
jgi:Phospholipase/Carboxylesterase